MLARLVSFTFRRLIPVAGTALVLAGAVVAVLVGAWSGDSAGGQASNLAERGTMPMVAKDGPVGTYSYTVKPGDTLYSIAAVHGTTVKVLQALNQISNPNILEVGWHLNIPNPTPTPTATPTMTPKPGPSTRIDHGTRGSGMVALTLDMGGRVEPALDIMNWLVAHQVPASIFMTGSMVDNVNTDAGRRVLAIIDAHPELFDLGNHSYSHPYFTTLTGSQMVQQLQSTEQSIAKYTNRSARPIWRPPYGDLNQSVLNAVGPAGYPYTVMWDVDTIDWKPVAQGGPTTAQIVSKVTNNAQGGSIVLMHLGGYNTYAALPQVVAGLESRGLTPVKLSTMLGYQQ